MDIALYNQLNASFGRTCTFKLGRSAGFFSEYNNMILAMAYCLIHRIRFQITSENTDFNVQKGWAGFFVPFCEEVEDDRLHYVTENWRAALKNIVLHRHYDAVLSLLPYLWPWKNEMRTQDVFGKCRDRKLTNRIYEIPSIGFRGSLQQLCAQLVNITWRYNEETQKRIEELIAPLNLPKRFIGMHIRGGDKFVEHEMEPLHKYFDLVSDDLNKNLFVLTDDYTIIEQIHKMYPCWHVYTLCQKTERGYFHAQFLKQSYEFQQNQLIKLFASIEVLSRSTQFIGTYSSNPGMFMGMRNPSICMGVDFDHWVIW